jgi:hypothetical protein
MFSRVKRPRTTSTGTDVHAVACSRCTGGIDNDDDFVCRTCFASTENELQLKYEEEHYTRQLLEAENYMLKQQLEHCRHISKVYLQRLRERPGRGSDLVLRPSRRPVHLNDDALQNSVRNF